MRPTQRRLDVLIQMCSLFQRVREIVMNQLQGTSSVSYNSLIASSSLVYYPIVSSVPINYLITSDAQVYILA